MTQVFSDQPLEPSAFAALHPVMAPSSPTAPSGVAITAPSLPFHIEIDERIRRMVDNAVRTYRIVVLVGLPGTGKGTIITELIRRVNADPSTFDLDTSHSSVAWPDPLKRSPDEGTALSDLVGGLIPAEGGGLRWSSGYVLDALASDRWLVLDELNRGDLDKILGPLLPWLAGESVELGTLTPAPGSPRILLSWDVSRSESYVDPPEGLDADSKETTQITYWAGRDFRLLGTFNPLDAHRVFPIGMALGRRFREVPIPPLSENELRTLLSERYGELSEACLDRVVNVYAAHKADPRTVLGAASFLDMPAYVLRGLNAAGAATTDTPEPMLSQLLQEAYVLCVGRFVRMYTPDVISALFGMTKLEAALGDGGVAWVQEAVKNL